MAVSLDPIRLDLIDNAMPQVRASAGRGLNCRGIALG